MIADPLFAQRLVKALNLRGSGPQVPVEILGAVITLDGGQLLEGLSTARLAGGESIFYGGSGRATSPAGIGIFSRVDLNLGWGASGGAAGFGMAVEVVYLRVFVETNDCTLSMIQDTGVGVATFNTDYRNVASGGALLLARGRWDLVSGGGDVLINPLFRTPILVNGVFEWTNPFPIISQRLVVQDDDFIHIRTSAQVTNLTITVTYAFVARIQAIPGGVAA